MKKVVGFLLVMVFACCAPATADLIHDNADSDDYLIKAPAMLLRGAGDIILAPVEILAHGYQGTMEGRPLVGTIDGTVRGVYWMLDRAGRGVWDVLTAFAPDYNGAPCTRPLDFTTE